MATLLPADLLRRHPEESARLLALGYLREAGHARRRMEEEADVEALHDFRVAVRRLRNCCRCYRTALRGSVPKKLRRRLRDITELTNASRNAEVLLRWTSGHRDHRGGSTAEVDDVLERLREDQANAMAVLSDRVAALWDPLADRLQRRLQTYRVELEPDSIGDARPFAALAGRALLDVAAQFRKRIALVNEPGTAAHRTRIAGKRMRYLLEPMAQRSKIVTRFVERLKELQDQFGVLHDVQMVIAELAEVPESSPAAEPEATQPVTHSTDHGDGHSTHQIDSEIRQRLTQLAQSELNAAYRVVEANWLRDRAEPLVAAVARYGNRLARRRSGAPPTEIERKYLLKSLPEQLQAAPAQRLSQGWLPGIKLVERIRRSRGPGGDNYTRTIKLGKGIERIEVEEEIAEELFASLWPLTEGKRVEKSRHELADGDLVWEIDQFHDRELVLAEVELPTRWTRVETPEWLAPYLVREVTGDPEYVNVNLAK